MNKPDRIKRPTPERTKPKRNVLGALGQEDAMASKTAPPNNGQYPNSGVPDGHPLGPGFADGVTDESLQFIQDGVRAASDLVDAHIRQGEETARTLGSGEGRIPLTQTDVSGLLTGLVRAYSDVASVWVDIVGNLASKIDVSALKSGEGAAPAAGGVASNIGLRITTADMVEAKIEMFRPAEAVVPQPLTATSPDAPPHITQVSFAANQIAVTVPKGQAPGTYHGLLLSAADQTPAGVLTLTVLDPGAAP